MLCEFFQKSGIGAAIPGGKNDQAFDFGYTLFQDKLILDVQGLDAGNMF